MNDSIQRVVRTVLQLIATGGLYEIADQVNADLNTPYFLLVYMFLVTAVQNYLEARGTIPAVLRDADPLVTPHQEQ